jgi:zinc/manganese transport system permease protein
VSQAIEVLFLPFLACLVLTGIHVYLGIHVISRKVIFVDLALAQTAALGSTVAFLIGFDPRSEGAYLFSLGFAVAAAAVFALTRTRHERVPQEAVIGLAYATASAAAILLADISPHGAQHLHDLLAGSIVWVTPWQIAETALFYVGIGAFHFVFRERFLLISLRPEEAYARGLKVRLWDFLFYLSFGVVITSSVQIAGVLLVFCYLVAPSVFAVMFFERLRDRLLTGWAMGTIVSAVGLLFSYDRPSGPTIMVCFAAALVLGAAGRSLAAYRRRPRAVAAAAGVAALAAALGWTAYQFRPSRAHHGGEGLEPPAPAAPEHEVGEAVSEWRAALRDTHENVRASAVARLAASGDRRVLPDLVDALHDQSAAVREAAASALGRLGASSALPALKQALRNPDEDAWVRLRVAQAVAGMGDADGIPVLLQLARGSEAGLARLEALAALVRLAGRDDPVPAAPDPAGEAELLARIEAWWSREGPSPRWDPDRRAFRR